ncbi:MAG: DUF885 domain-containing protein, partial [Actinobacteria bacterium]|nr:DUF885 domain-containing protein [Actinomycetota bacterium]
VASGVLSTVFEISDRYVAALCQLNPTLATSLGVPGHDHRWGDHGMGGLEANHELRRSFRADLEPHLDAADPRDRLAARVAARSIGESLESHEAGDHFRDLRHLGSPFHRIRQIFDIMPTETSGHWSNIVSRLETIDQPFGGYLDRLIEGIERGITVARRQVLSIIDQAEKLAAEGSAFESLLAKGEATGHLDERLEEAIVHARAAAGKFGEGLRESYLPHARDDDAAGEEVYRRMADRMVGMEVDPEDAYLWGWEEFHRIHQAMSEVGEEIVPGARFDEVKEHLETHPDGLAHSTDELVETVDRILTEAVESLAGRHFEVPEAIRPLTVNIAPPGGPLGVYYLRPSEDFSRPGGVWYSLGDQAEFPLYQHVSTAYHEGFPGHHLQIATAMYRREDLSRVQRSLIFYPGYSEGWAMYAEVLMGELGYLDDPRYQFGMLAKQMYRASRIVVDIGLHLEKPIASSSPVEPGEPWTIDNATRFMEMYGFRTPAQAEAEVLRYLGWPGQAIAYKLGEREILSIREEAKSRRGAEFELKDFHASVIENGPMGLDLLRQVVVSG